MVFILIGGILAMVVLAAVVIYLSYVLLLVLGIIESPKPKSRVMPDGVIISYGYCPYCRMQTAHGSYEGYSMCYACEKPDTNYTFID